MAEDYYYDFGETPEEYWESGADSYFIEAQQRIKDIYERERNSVFYVRQMQIMLEKEYFHWITFNALMGLIEIEYLRDIRLEREKGTSTRYFVYKSNRYPMRRIRQIEKLILEYSNETITRSCGHRAEDLFCNALALKGFQPKDKKVRSYNGVTWEETGHDLDFLFERDGIAYGCEIKNTLGYIEKEELEIKLKMCEHLGIVPLFIMRWSPKTYNKMIIDSGGFVMIYGSQIYELSQIELVKKLKTEIGLPVDCPKAIPEGIIERFIKWHKRKHM